MRQQIEFFYRNAIETEGTEVVFIDKESTGNAGNFRIKSGNFLKLSENFIENRNFTKDSTLTKKCDGVVVEQNLKKLLVVEIKTTIGFQTFISVLQQLCASYLKTLQYLSILEDIQNIDIEFFIIGNWENDIESKVGEFKEGELSEQDKIYHAYQKLIRKKQYVFPKMPHSSFLSEKIANIYQKTGVKIWYYEPNSTHSI